MSSTLPIRRSRCQCLESRNEKKKSFLKMIRDLALPVAKFVLTIAMSFSLDGFLIIVDFVVCNAIEWILSIWSFVNGCIVLVATLNDSFRCSTHQYNMIVCTGNSCVFYSICFVPCYSFKNVRLWSSRYFVSTSVIFYLSRRMQMLLFEWIVH